MIPPIVKIYSTRAAAGILAILLFSAATGISNNFFLLRFGIMVFLGAIAINFLTLKCRQLALLSLAAAILFNPYVYPNLPRHIWVILDIITLVGVVYAAYWATDPYKKGTRFEEYVTTLFPEPDFVIQDRTRDNSKYLKRHVESDGHPDLVFRSQNTRKSFAIECKWRAKWAYGKHGELGIWWKPYQAERYAAYGKESGMPVFVAFGIGGSPQKPDEVYFLEAERLHYVFLNQSLIKSGQTPTRLRESLI